MKVKRLQEQANEFEQQAAAIRTMLREVGRIEPPMETAGGGEAESA